jgi:hypothetical protein
VVEWARCAYIGKNYGYVFNNEDIEEATTQPLTISTDKPIKVLQDMLRERKRAEEDGDSQGSRLGSLADCELNPA